MVKTTLKGVYWLGTFSNMIKVGKVGLNYFLWEVKNINYYQSKIFGMRTVPWANADQRLEDQKQ